jgi:hypothetical protein
VCGWECHWGKKIKIAKRISFMMDVTLEYAGKGNRGAAFAFNHAWFLYAARGGIQLEESVTV